ncbi:MAG: carbon storage regulator CsrA [Treponema sp.]|nr:carbon storage regulator CsrA [Treponema sp.]
MLILSRKVNEKIMIGDDISISIIEIRGDQIRIGVDAPKTVKVFRQEVFDAIKAENKAAAESKPVLPDVHFGGPQQEKALDQIAKGNER